MAHQHRISKKKKGENFQIPNEYGFTLFFKGNNMHLKTSAAQIQIPCELDALLEALQNAYKKKVMNKKKEVHGASERFP